MTDPRYFAIDAHGDQTYSGSPYVRHLDAVARIVAPYGEDFVTLAYLHDTVEDTSVTPSIISDFFGKRMGVLVDLITDPPTGTRDDKKRVMNKRFSELKDTPFNSPLFVVKAADRLANVRSCIVTGHTLIKRYRKEHGDFKAALYRHALCDELWLELDHLLQ